jgi:GAF domain-containing protein
VPAPPDTTGGEDALTAAGARMAELERQIAHAQATEAVGGALYRIAETASSASDLQAFYARIHEIVRELMYADNFYIALFDERRGMVNYPFYVDEVDPDTPDPGVWEPLGTGEAAGFTGWVLRLGKPVLLTSDQQHAVIEREKLSLIGIPAIDWMAAPLRTDDRTIGVVVAQSYREDRVHSQRDLELLTFVAQHIATALTRARAIEETRQRNAELAIVNEIGAALAQQLDFDAIIELVGERIRGIFEASSIFVGITDEDAKIIRFPYSIENDAPLVMDALPFGVGLSAQVLATRQPLRIGSFEEAQQLGAVQAGARADNSWLGVPILAGERAIGLVGIESPDRHAFSESDERLLSTLASAMGVALENARLFDETKRLLAETEQRNDELAVVNEIGAALAQQLDFDAIIELVGNRLATMVDSRDMFIGLYDRATNLISFPYEIERGTRVHGDPIELGVGLSSTVLRERRPLRFGTAEEQSAAGGFIGT